MVMPKSFINYAVIPMKGQPFPAPGDLPDPGIEPTSLMSPALAGEFFTSSTTRGSPSER